MNCRDFELIVLTLARQPVPEAKVWVQSQAHLNGCVRCTARLAEERALLAGIQAVVSELANEKTPAHLEATLLAALRAQTVQHQTLKASSVKAPWMSWRFAVAVAAMLLVAILVGVTWQQSTSKKPMPQARQLSVTAASPTPEVDSNDGTSNAHEAMPLRAAVHRRSPRRSFRQPVAPPGEIATPFYSLVEDGALASVESGRIVRVEVPASTLIPFGVPLTAETSTQPVQADLLLGQDGLARAIRFLPAGQNTKMQ